MAMLTCPQGHRWQPVIDGNALTTDFRVPCPECGSLVQVVAPDDGPALVGGETGSYSAPLERRQEGSAAPHQEASRPVIPGYEILGELGRGGMGVVYKARQVRLHRMVALKMILAGSHAGTQDQERFRSEAEAVARLQHPNIVQIHEIGDVDGLPFFSLEYLEGGSLSQKLNGTPLPSREAAQLVETLARAMEAAHQCGIIHRDLKPANILLQDPRPWLDNNKSSALQGETGRQGDKIAKRVSLSPCLPVSLSECVPKITDFGLAKRLDSFAGQTQIGAIMGTPSYMAPEQASGKIREIGPAADVYALGAILYETLTGRPPFRAETPVDTILQVISDEPVPPSRLRPRIPRDLETICLKCLQKDPRKRYSSAQALADDLHFFLHDEPIRARPVGWPGRLWRWAKRNPGVARLTAALAFILIAVTAGALVAAFRFNRVAEEAQESRKNAEGLSEENRQKVYAARIKVAHQAWEIGDTGRTLELLDSLLPETGQEDLRGFEWHYLWHLCHSDRFTLAGHEGPVRCVAYSPDGKALSCLGCPGRGLCRIGDDQSTCYKCVPRSGQPGAGLRPSFPRGRA